MSSFRLLLRPSTVILLTVLLVVPELFGQSRDEEVKGPFYDVSVMEAQKPWLPWLLGVLFIVAVLAVAVRNPHRTHLD